MPRGATALAAALLILVIENARRARLFRQNRGESRLPLAGTTDRPLGHRAVAVGAWQRPLRGVSVRTSDRLHSVPWGTT